MILCTAEVHKERARVRVVVAWGWEAIFWSLDPVDKKGVKTEWDKERRALISACGCCEGYGVKKGQSRYLNSVHGEWTVKGNRQMCIKGPNEGEMEAVKVQKGRRGKTVNRYNGFGQELH